MCFKACYVRIVRLNTTQFLSTCYLRRENWCKIRYAQCVLMFSVFSVCGIPIYQSSVFAFRLKRPINDLYHITHARHTCAFTQPYFDRESDANETKAQAQAQTQTLLRCVHRAQQFSAVNK